MSNQVNNSPILASAVQVRFPARRCAGDPSDSYPDYYKSSIALSSVPLVIPGPPGGYTGHLGIKIFNESALADYSSPSADATNKTSLDNLTNQVSKDFYNWKTFSFDEVLNGVVAPIPNGILSEIEWTYTDDDANTRLFADPVLDDCDELAHSDPADTGCVDQNKPNPAGPIVDKIPAWEEWGPPATFSGSSIHISRFNITLEDGRFRRVFVQTDIVGCGCATASGVPQPGCPCNPMPSTMNGTGNYATIFGPPGRDPTSLGCPTTFTLTAQTRPSGFQAPSIVANNTVWMSPAFTFKYYTYNPNTGNYDILNTTSGAVIIYWCQPQNGQVTCQIYDSANNYGGVNALLAQTGDPYTVHLGCTPFLWQYNATTSTWTGRTNLSA